MSHRDHILATALERFAHQGIAATTIQDVADHAGVSKASVLYHFDSKDHLVDLALEPGIAALGQLVESMRSHGLDSPSARRAFVEAFVDFLLAHRNATHIVVAHPYLAADIHSLARAQQLMTTMAELVSTTHSGEDDRLRFGVAVSGATYALVSSAMLGVDPLDDETLRSGLREVLSQMMLEPYAEVSR